MRNPMQPIQCIEGNRAIFGGRWVDVDRSRYVVRSVVRSDIEAVQLYCIKSTVRVD